MPILDLPWIDLYVTKEPETSWYLDHTNDHKLHYVQESEREEIREMRRVLDGLADGDTSFTISWGDAPDHLRVTPFITATVAPLFVLKRFKAKPGLLKDLGFPAAMVRWLTEKPLDPGMYIFMGAQDAGKTTSLFSLMIEQLKLHGGIAATVENPIEMKVEGQHGKGQLLQTQIKDDRAMGDGLRALLRSGANKFIGGEIKGPHGAEGFLDIARSGHVAGTSFHAADIPSGLRRFADDTGGNFDAFADCLSAVFFQRFITPPAKVAKERAQNGLPGWTHVPDRRLIIEPLVITKFNRSSVSSHLRNNTFQQLSSEIKAQKEAFLRGEMVR